jgi:integrase
MGHFEYLSTVSPATANIYTVHLKTFFRVLYPKESAFERKKFRVPDETFEKYATQYFAERKKKLELYEKDIYTLFVTLKDRPSLSQRQVLCAVRVWLEENRIELSHRFWKRLSKRIKGNRPLTQDKIPSKSEFKGILSHLDSKGRALYLLLASSGMRIGEALMLKIGDIDFTHEPTRISIPATYTKTKNSRITFCSGEAKEAILAWLKFRPKYLEIAAKRSGRYIKKIEGENRIFPFEHGTAMQVWEHALQKAGLAMRDNETDRLIFHPHVLRKLFRTELGKISVDSAEILLGHSGYLTDSYLRLSEEDLEKFYRDAEPAISFFTTGVEDLNKIREEYENLIAENQKLKADFDRIKAEWERRKDFEQKWFDGVDYDLIQAVVDEIKKRKQLELQKEWQQAERRTAAEDRREVEEQKKLTVYAKTDVLAQPANNV